MTPLFRNLPEATLAAIVVVAVAGMFKWRESTRLYSLRRQDLALAVVTFLAVLTFDEALWALLLAVILSLLALVWRASQGQMSELGLVHGKLQFEEVGAASDVIPISGLLIFAPEESLFFANADSVRMAITNRLAAAATTATEPLTGVLLDLELSNELDVPSADTLVEPHDDLEAAGVQLMLARVRPAVRDLLDRSGTTGAVGEEHSCGSILEGVLAHLSKRAVTAETFLGLSGDTIKAPQMAVADMLVTAEGNRRAQLENINIQLTRVSAETGSVSISVEACLCTDTREERRLQTETSCSRPE